MSPLFLLSQVPFEILLTVLYVVISYFMIGFQADAAKFFIAMGVMIMFMLTSVCVLLIECKHHVVAATLDHLLINRKQLVCWWALCAGR